MKPASLSLILSSIALVGMGVMYLKLDELSERVGNERLVRRRRIAVRSLAFRPADFEVVSGLAVGEEIAVTSMRRLREDETVHVGGVTSP